MRPLVAVIIPFYQKERGILARSLISVIHQDANVRLRVVIVDDASPITAESEVALCPDLSGIELTIIHQSNGGPGSARNAGLDSLRSDTDFVAFLDSDDEWTLNHIKRAVSILEAGYGFYFSNIYQVAATVGAFERAGRLVLSDHERLSIGNNFYAFCGDMVRQIAFIISSSSIPFSGSLVKTLKSLL